jgi:hypothetical protein
MFPALRMMTNGVLVSTVQKTSVTVGSRVYKKDQIISDKMG